MTVIVVNKPSQGSGTPPDELELVENYESYHDVDGIMESHQYIPTWCVKSEMLKVGETFQQWLKRKEEYIEKNPRYQNVEGIYLYDIQAVLMPCPELATNNVGAMIIRYEFIKPKPF